MEKYLKINDEEGPSAKVFPVLDHILLSTAVFRRIFPFIEAIKLNPTSRDDFLNLLDAAKSCGKTDDAKKYSKSIGEFPSLETIAGNLRNS